MWGTELRAPTAHSTGGPCPASEQSISSSCCCEGGWNNVAHCCQLRRGQPVTHGCRRTMQGAARCWGTAASPEPSPEPSPQALLRTGKMQRPVLPGQRGSSGQSMVPEAPRQPQHFPKAGPRGRHRGWTRACSGFESATRARRAPAPTPPAGEGLLADASARPSPPTSGQVFFHVFLKKNLILK